jgi:Double-GTPase 2
MIAEKEEGTDLDVFEQVEREEGRPTEKDWVPLPHANLLNVEDADELMRWRAANVVAIVGERDAGKTTLVTEIYERFLRGPFAGLLFAGSRTLAGFERRCYLARLVSGASAPDTERTSVQAGLRFFHLGLASEQDGRRVDLLISERAGESYRAARNYPSITSGFLELERARTVVFVLDGARIADDNMREETFSSVRNLIRVSAETNAVSVGAEVQLVTTKIDLLRSEASAHALEAVSLFEQRMEATYGPRFAKITSWRTAARNPSGNAEPALGVAALLQSWLSPPKPHLVSIPTPALYDEFDRFLLRGGVA